MSVQYRTQLLSLSRQPQFQHVPADFIGFLLPSDILINPHNVSSLPPTLCVESPTVRKLPWYHTHIDCV
jgi:hypothetical protein